MPFSLTSEGKPPGLSGRQGNPARNPMLI